MEKALFLQYPCILSISTPLLVLGILVLLGVLFWIFMIISAARVKVDVQDLFPTKEKESETHTTITVGFFSDTHGWSCLRSPKWIAGKFLANQCQVVLFGGDCVHKKPVHASDRKMLTEVSALLKSSGIDLYAVYGNHDWRLTESDFQDMGVHLLKDADRVLTFGDASFAICGIADSERGRRPWGTIPESFSSYDGFRLLIVHNPDYLYSLPDLSEQPNDARPFDFMLAGHLHGGQVHLPGNLEFTLLRKDRIAHEEGILGGKFTFRGYRGLISNGAGNGFLPIRLFARPEIHILKFHI